MKNILILLVLLVSPVAECLDVFNEELFLQQLETGNVYSYFQFLTTWDINIFDQELGNHFNLFPKSFGEIVSVYGIAEVHLSLTQGRWNYNKWGYPIENAPTGIEMWVWFHPDLNKTSVDNNWNGLVHAWSGQFCSSLNFIDKSLTSSPTYSMKPLGLWVEGTSPETHLRYAVLPSETVCTENLTPWKKLLPCAGKAGLGSLLDALRLYNSAYHSLAIHLRSIKENGIVKVELKQSISSVFDARHANIIDGWSLKNIFGTKLYSKCPLASISAIVVDVSHENGGKSILQPKPTEWKQYNISKQNYQFAIYDLSAIDLSSGFDVISTIKSVTKDSNSPYLLARKYTTGYGKEMGGSTCVITNSHKTESIRIFYFDIFPYFVRTYFHTLSVEIDGIIVEPEQVKYTPAYYRNRPATLELSIDLPPLSTAVISIDFEKVFLDWLQHPPNAEHGFYIGSAVISAMLPDRSNGTGFNVLCSYLSRPEECVSSESISVFRRIYTEPLLIRPPLPDFSMPYNVICLTCTVIAIAFGSIFNLTTRAFEVEGEDDKKSIKQKLITFFQKFFRKVEVSETDTMIGKADITTSTVT